MEKPYHIVGKASREELGRYLAKNGQVLLPMVELIKQSKMAVDALIDVLGRAQIEAVAPPLLEMECSVVIVAGERSMENHDKKQYTAEEKVAS